MSYLIKDLKIGESYPNVVRQFCISIHYHSPAAYRTVRKHFIKNLPHPNTIASWYRYSNIKGEPGFHTGTFDRLRIMASDVKKNTGKDSVCCLIADEMFIRKQILWCNQSQKYVGYVSYGASTEDGLLPIANQAIVFMLTGINQQFEFPIGYHLIKTLNTAEKTDIFVEVLTKLTECGIDVKCLTFDGLKTNFSMCEKLGADLNIFSTDFKPYILNPVNKSKIFICFDNSHAEKLARNTLANKRTIFDDKLRHIKWKHIEDLVTFSEKNNLRTHKLNKKHVDYESSIMNVRIATETMSNSVADSLKFLQDKGVFTRQRGMSAENKEAIYKFLDETTQYIKSLKINVGSKNQKPKREVLTTSINGTGFRGYVINMAALKGLFEELVEEKQYTDVLYTYKLSQDHIERFFGKLRAFHGFNNNPDVICFQSAFKKLSSNIQIAPPLKTNCQQFHMQLSTCSTYSDIFYVPSTRPKLIENPCPDFMSNVTRERDQISSYVMELDEMDRTYYLTDGFAGASIAYVAQLIESKIKENFNCDRCRFIFDENEKVLNCYKSSTADSSPCRSTYDICATTDKFLRVHKWNDKSNFKIKYFLIFQDLDFDNLYRGSCFLEHEDHKFHLIKSIISEYSRIRGNQFSRKITVEEIKSILRKKLNKLILSEGQ